MSRLTDATPTAITHTYDGSVIAFGETNPARFREGLKTARVYTPDSKHDTWRLVWFSMHWGRLRPVESEPHESWLYTQISERLLTAAEVDYCRSILQK